MNIVDKLREKKELLFSGKGEKEEAVDLLENELKLRFSDDFRACLLAFGTFAFDGHEFTGVSESPRLSVADVTNKCRAAFPDVPADWYVIEEANIDGIVIWQNAEGTIYLTRPNDEPDKLAANLQEFLQI